MEKLIDEQIAFFWERQKKLFDDLKESYTLEEHNLYSETVDIVKDLYEVKKMMSIAK